MKKRLGFLIGIFVIAGLIAWMAFMIKNRNATADDVQPVNVSSTNTSLPTSTYTLIPFTPTPENTATPRPLSDIEKLALVSGDETNKGISKNNPDIVFSFDPEVKVVTYFDTKTKKIVTSDEAKTRIYVQRDGSIWEPENVPSYRLSKTNGIDIPLSSFADVQAALQFMFNVTKATGKIGDSRPQNDSRDIEVADIDYSKISEASIFVLTLDSDDKNSAVVIVYRVIATGNTLIRYYDSIADEYRMVYVQKNVGTVVNQMSQVKVPIKFSVIR